MKKSRIIFGIAFVCAVFGTVMLVISKQYLCAVFLVLTIPVLIKKIKEEKSL